MQEFLSDGPCWTRTSDLGIKSPMRLGPANRVLCCHVPVSRTFVSSPCRRGRLNTLQDRPFRLQGVCKPYKSRVAVSRSIVVAPSPTRRFSLTVGTPRGAGPGRDSERPSGAGRTQHPLNPYCTPAAAQPVYSSQLEPRVQTLLFGVEDALACLFSLTVGTPKGVGPGCDSERPAGAAGGSTP